MSEKPVSPPVETYSGYAIYFSHISYNCPALGIYGERDLATIKRSINKKLKPKKAKS